jgi:tRNA A-37 threonylcarbamoyl transferase component Bud32
VQPGSNFGQYRILEPLGRGGMATVYRAYEASLDRYVALKVLPADSLNDPEFTARFRREAKVIAALEHRHIVPIYGYGIDEGVPWMAMRLIPGGPLSGRIRDGPFKLGRAVFVLSEVAAALDFAHERGVLHRDVKPQNVLLDGDGHAYLADFGVAKMLESTAAVTRSGVVTGTPLYMSPEQARGETVDHRTDIYALGIVAYELLTGRVPFSADTPVAVLMKHVLDPLPMPPASQVPEQALRAILKCAAKDPADRWPSARRFTDALRAAGGAALDVAAWASAQPTVTHVRVPRSFRYTMILVGAAGVLVAAVLYPGWRQALLGRDPFVPSTRTPRPTVAMTAVPSRASVSPSPATAPPPAFSSVGRPDRALATTLPANAAAPAGRPRSVASWPATTPPAEPAMPKAPDPVASSSPSAPDPVPPPPASAPTTAAADMADGVSFLVGQWTGHVLQRKNPFSRRELERSVKTECRRLPDPSRVFCRNDWGIIEDWVAIRHDPPKDRYLYEDSDGLKALGIANGAEMVYEGTLKFKGETLSWRLTCIRRGRDSFTLQMQWSRDSTAWYTIYDAAYQRDS